MLATSEQLALQDRRFLAAATSDTLGVPTARPYAIFKDTMVGRCAAV
jgi:hypothetical protein